ncbi:MULTISPECIES: flagellar protein FlgN [unclassified Nocardioides]|uniref:flagellar protein FlgN n=1 Tax=unclassified Nocardioides TaxID=2615069 RepID=UPI002666C6ED|nr:flagellar protein FlgN [Nocardioides sp. Arc9.136]WKN47628.1 flagellar protein FlgN [Nocardioides sp. Arc9.136]
MENLSATLWHERELLETLQYHLEVEQLVLASGRTTWLMRAAKDVESVLEQLRTAEVLRSAEADGVGERLGLDPAPTLQQLVDASPEPWRTILAEHRDALTSMTREITALADSNRDLLSAGHRSARETLLAIGGTTLSYGADGSAVTQVDAPALVDRTF